MTQERLQELTAKMPELTDEEQLEYLLLILSLPPERPTGISIAVADNSSKSSTQELRFVKPLPQLAHETPLGVRLVRALTNRSSR